MKQIKIGPADFIRVIQKTRKDATIAILEKIERDNPNIDEAHLENVAFVVAATAGQYALMLVEALDKLAVPMEEPPEQGENAQLA